MVLHKFSSPVAAADENPRKTIDGKKCNWAIKSIHIKLIIRPHGVADHENSPANWRVGGTVTKYKWQENYPTIFCIVGRCRRWFLDCVYHSENGPLLKRWWCDWWWSFIWEGAAEAEGQEIHNYKSFSLTVFCHFPSCLLLVFLLLILAATLRSLTSLNRNSEREPLLLLPN